MKDTVTNEVAGSTKRTMSANNNRLSRLLPTGARSQPASVQPVTPVAVEEPINDGPADEFDEETAEERLKDKFVNALTAHCKAEISLTEVVGEMIAAEVERDTAIEWGIEAGLSDGYVRSTVSRLYIELTGERMKKSGGGRKANKGAKGVAIRALKECDGDVAKAKALLLAARRLIEKWEKAGTVETMLKSA